MAWDEIGYIQVADTPGRFEPTTGEINYLNVFRHLHAKGYDGIIGMEHRVAIPGVLGEEALIEAYKKLPTEARVTLYSDSQLCVNTINQWAAGWERRGWKRKGGEVKNLDLVKRLWALAQARPGVKLEWIKAHDGTRWNEYADALASEYQRG